MNKFYTKKGSNLVFKIKNNSDLTGLIAVDPDKELKRKNLEWIKQVQNDDDYVTILVYDNYTDSRILCHIDICHNNDLSDDCSEVITIFK